MILGVAGLLSFSPGVTAIGAAAACSALGVAGALHRRSTRVARQPPADAQRADATPLVCRALTTSRLWPLAPLSANEAARVESFLDRLCALSASEWHALGQDAEWYNGREQSAETATAIVEAIIADLKLEVAAWYLRDVVETIAYLAGRRLGSHGVASHYLAAAQVAAQRAALGLLVSSVVPRAELDVLYAPVANYVQPAEFCLER